jgi:hypothetical protein
MNASQPAPNSAPATASAWHRFACGFFLLVAGALAQAQEDPPGRVARLNLAEGAVTTAAADTGQWTAAELNRPLTGGDRVWTDQAARAELHVGSTALRMDSQTSLDFMQLDDQVTQIRLNQGRINLRVRQLWEGERLEIDTPNLAFVVNQPGDYRIEVDPARNLTRVAAASGAATLYGEGGESAKLGAAQQLAMTGRNLNPVRGQDIALNDAFDRWTDERDRREDQSVSARYVSRETIGYQQLDAHGDWQTDATYGPVWYPRVAVADWAPYRYGQWRWIAPWGWTWVDDAPWGFAPFHYGRWAQVGPRWCWVPGPIARRPVYAPALVGFSGAGGAVQWNVGAAAGRPDVGWFPLGPGEPWRPGFRASARYIDNVNRPVVIHQGSRRPDGYVHQNRPGAMTAVPAVEFDQRRPVRAHWHRERDPGPGAGSGRPQAVAPLPSVQPAPMAPFGRERGGTFDSGRADPDHRRGDDRARTEQDRVRNEQFQREQQERAQQRQMDMQNPRLAGPQQGPHEQALRAQMQRDQAQRDRMQREQQVQREQHQHQQQQQIQARQQAAMDQAQRQQMQIQREQAQRERAQDQQREQQERAMRQQQEQQVQVQRQQQEHQARVQRQQQEHAERAQRQVQEQQQRAQRQQQQEKEMADRSRANGREGPPGRLQPNR